MKNYIAVILLCIISLTGCASSVQELEVDELVEDTVKVGLSIDSYVTERWVKDRDVFVSTIQELGGTVNTQVANGVVEEQQEQIEYFIEEGMDAIVIVPIDGNALTEQIAHAKEEGVVVIAYDRMIRNAELDYYLSFDNVEVGRLMGQMLVQQHPEGGEIIAIYGPLMDDNVRLVEQGFLEVIEGSNLTLIYRDYCNAWIGEEAVDILLAGLEQTTNLVGVMCGNDDLAGHAITQLSELQMLEGVTVVSQDADLIACQRIVEGTQTMTVFKNVELLAKKVAEYTIHIVLGVDVEEEVTMENGYGAIPSILLEPIAITLRNINTEIIDTGYHYREDVYMNVK